MELSKEIIADVIKERISNGTSKENVFGDASQLDIKDAELFLSSGLSIAIHILLGHADCKAKEPGRCPAVRQLEVWTIKVLGDGISAMDNNLVVCCSSDIYKDLRTSFCNFRVKPRICYRCS